MATVNKSDLRVKGTRDGFLVEAPHIPGDSLAEALAVALAEQQTFLQGSRIVLDVGARRLTRNQLSAALARLQAQGLTLWTVLSSAAGTREAARSLGLATRLPGSQTDLDGNRLAATAVPAALAKEADSDAAQAGLVLRDTIRSGRSVYHDGPVIVIGDVNPGAEIVAAGDVVVWGRLRGLVHAGALGDAGAVVCALELAPTQLRIADQIAVTPGGHERRVRPEMASIQGEQIVAQAWPARP